MDYSDLLCGACNCCKTKNLLGTPEWVCELRHNEATEHYEKTGEIKGVEYFAINPFDPICEKEQERRAKKRQKRIDEIRNNFSDLKEKANTPVKLRALAQEIRKLLEDDTDALAKARECEKDASKMQTRNMLIMIIGIGIALIITQILRLVN